VQKISAYHFPRRDEDKLEHHTRLLATPQFARIEFVWLECSRRAGLRHIKDSHDLDQSQVEESARRAVATRRLRLRHREDSGLALILDDGFGGCTMRIVANFYVSGAVLYLMPITAYRPDGTISRYQKPRKLVRMLRAALMDD
jgi:hypothetical protein